MHSPKYPSGLTFGASDVASAADTRYLWPGFADSQAPASAVQCLITRPGTLRNLYVLHNGPAGNGNDIVYTVRKNGVATALTVTLASTGSIGQDTAHSVSVAAGDRLDLEADKALDIGTSPTNVIAAMELAS